MVRHGLAFQLKKVVTKIFAKKLVLKTVVYSSGRVKGKNRESFCIEINLEISGETNNFINISFLISRNFQKMTQKFRYS